MNGSMIVTLAALSAVSIACNCRSEPAEYPATPGMTPASGPVPEAKKQSDLPTQAQISIAQDIVKACGISDPDAYFAFDSAKITEQAERVGKELVTCFTTGPLKGRSLRLVGHADPRGSDEYNMVLGQHRADNYMQFLVSGGLPQDKATDSSRGEMDATGTDEATWALDRRVDVLLAD